MNLPGRTVRIGAFAHYGHPFYTGRCRRGVRRPTMRRPQEMSGATLDNLSTESRSFPPPEGFAEQANATEEWYKRADADRDGFWAEQAQRLTWAEPFGQVLDWQPPFAKWFVDGKLNVAYNCVDRHVEAGHGEQVAFHWEGEPGDSRTITYADLQREVCQAANALTELGVVAGDRVAIQLPMIPEAVISMLACARLGAAHSVVFGGFSPGALKARVLDAEAKLLITSDGQYRRGQPAPMKENTDEAVGGHAVDRARPRRQAHGDRGAVDRGSRRLVARDRRPAVRDARARGVRRRDTRCSSSTRPGRRGRRRASCTPPAASSPRPRTPTTSCSTTSPARASTGARPTSAGSPGTATSSTDRWRTGRRR